MPNIEFKFEKGRRFGKAKGPFSKAAHGIDIVLKHDLPPKRSANYHLAPNKDPDYNVLCIPDEEYRWCQTIDTNDPLGGVTNPYVDPRPSDDPGTPKPFYWTDVEHVTKKEKFNDSPSRGAPAVGTTTWRATLSLCAVNAKEVKLIMNIRYGFDIDNTGKLTKVKPVEATNAQVQTHINTLKSEFGTWTFKEA